MQFMRMMFLMLVGVLCASQARAQYVDDGRPLVDTWGFPTSADTPDLSDYPTEHDVLDWFEYQAIESQTTPRWSPSGDSVAFLSAYTGLWIVPAQGGKPTLVSDEFYYQFENTLIKKTIREICGFSPDGKELLFLERVRISDSFDESNSEPYTRNLNAVTIDTGEIRTIEQHVYRAIFSPDGRYAVYEHIGEENVLVDFQTGDRIELDDPESIYMARFSPDGSAVAYAEDAAIWMMQVSRHPTSTLLLETNADRVQINAFTPDGRWLLYSTSLPGKYQYEVITKINAVNIETGETVVLSNDGDRINHKNADVSPDGEYYVYSYTDLDHAPNITRVYIRKLPDEMHPVTIVGKSDSPSAFAINGNRPNPFNPSTAISFSLDTAGHAGLAVISLTGQRVRTLVDGARGAGRHEVVWNGCDERGVRVSSGTYVARLTCGGATTSHVMTLVK
jgi:Tol biopolymer transport system component